MNSIANAEGRKAIPRLSGLGWALALLALVLSLSIFTHVVTCAPCYDDDVCASARIDGADQLSATHIVEIGLAAEKAGSEIAPAPPFVPLALAESIRDMQPPVPMPLPIAPTAPSARFSHPRTDVLLI